MNQLCTFLSKFKCKSINICDFFTKDKNNDKTNASSVIGYI